VTEDSRQPRLGRPLLTAPARRWAVGLLAGCAVLVAGLGVLFAHQTQAGRLDHAVDTPVISWLHRRPELALHLAYPGSVLPAAVLSAVIAVGCLLTRQLRGAVLAAVAVPVCVELDELLLKPLFHRTYLGVLSYPSGHTTAISALAMTLTVLLLVPPHPARPWALRAVAPAVAWLLTIAVAVGVLGLRWHYFTDTVGGAAVSIGTVCALALLLDLPPVGAALAWVARHRPGGKVRAINDRS
jgi:membrane-associated phospholipid phosphatase